MKKTLYIVLAATALTHAAHAQSDSTITRNVDVVNTYLPTLVNPFKMQVAPELDDTMSYRPTFAYSVINKTQSINTPPDSLAPATMTFHQDESPYKALVRAAGGNYTSFMGELLYNIGLSEKYHLSLDLGHHSMLGKVKLSDDSKVKAPDSHTWVGVDFATYFKKSILTANVGFDNENYRYYGLQTLDSTQTYQLTDGTQALGSELMADKKQRRTTFDIGLGFGNKLVDPRDKFTYAARVAVGTFANKTDISEFNLRIGGDIRAPFATNYYFGAGVDVNNFKTSVPDESSALYTFDERKHTDVDVSPHLGVDFDHINIRMGFHMIFEMGGEEDNLYMQPDIVGNFNIADDIFSIYAGLSGEYRANSFRQIVEENPYVSSDACNYIWKAEKGTFVEGDEMPTTQADISIIAGVKALFSKHVEMHLDMDYHSFTDELFYVNRGYQQADNDNVDYSNLFGIMTENGSLLTLGGEFNIRPTDASTIQLRAKYYKWSLDYLEEAWYKPTYEVGISTRFYPTERLKITAGLDVLGDRYAYNQTLGGKEKLKTLVDLNIGGEYYITSRWTAFANFKNCAAQDYERWLGYSSHRFNMMLGATFKF